MKVGNIVERWFGRAANAASLWPLIPSGLAGITTALLASGVDWLNQYGAFGWWSAGILGFLLTAYALAGVGLARERWALAKAARKWSREVHSVNPMAPTFDQQRIRLQDIKHPITPSIENKRFTSCQLIGQANIILHGKGVMNDCAFSNCDTVIIKRGEWVFGALEMRDCVMLNCEFISCTFYVTQEDYERILKPIGAKPITYQKGEA